MKLPTAPAAYKAAREERGTQSEVAEALGVHRVTLVNRETGNARYPITTEAALAMLALPVKVCKTTVVATKTRPIFSKLL